MSPSKKDATLLFLQCSTVRVHIDPTKAGVVLPPCFIEGRRPLRLDYSLHSPISIPDLVVDDKGISATLSFDLIPHPTFVPWEALFCIVSPDFGGVVWNDDVPDALDAVLDSEAGTQPAQPAVESLQDERVTQQRVRPDWLRVV